MGMSFQTLSFSLHIINQDFNTLPIASCLELPTIIPATITLATPETPNPLPHVPSLRPTDAFHATEPTIEPTPIPPPLPSEDSCTHLYHIEKLLPDLRQVNSKP